MTRDELRELLLSTGLEMLAEEGLAGGADRLTFKRVFDRVEDETGVRVTNASVIRRIWTDNEDYQHDVLRRAISDHSADGLEAAIRRGDRVVKRADLSSAAGRRAAVSELCRVAGGALAQALSESQSWHLVMGALGNMASQPDDHRDDRITDAARAAYSELTRRVGDAMAGLTRQIGLRPKAGLNVQQFALAVVALSAGCAVGDRVDPDGVRKIRLPSGPGGRRQEWHLLSVGLEALVWQFMELEPGSRR